LATACELPETATQTELLAALRLPQNMDNIDAFLRDPVVQAKFDRHMTLIEHSLALFAERLGSERPQDMQALQTAISQVRLARQSGARVTLLEPIIRTFLFAGK